MSQPGPITVAQLPQSVVLASLSNQGNAPATWTPDMATYTDRIFRATITQATVINGPTNLKAGSRFTLELTQDATGGHSVVLPSAILPAGALTVTTAANAVTVIDFYSPDGAALVGMSSAMGEVASGQIDVFTTKRLLAAGSSPTTTLRTNAGVGAAIASYSGQPSPLDMRGAYTLTTGSSAVAAGQLLTTTQNLGTSPIGRLTVVLQALNAAAFDAQLYPQMFSNGFDVFARNAPPISTALSFAYAVFL